MTQMSTETQAGNATPCVHFDIYGYRVRIECAVPEVLQGLADDFAFFAAEPAESERSLLLVEEEPDYAPWAQARASVYTPRNVAYRQGEQSIIDYSGRGIGVHDLRTGSLRVSSLNHDLLYEVAYLFLLSQAGEELDDAGLHRVHALGVSVHGVAALVLLPMGGGKSTLGAALLEHSEIELLSDDSPLIGRDGSIRAFPLRIGLLPGAASKIPAEQLRKIQRMEFGPKLLVSYKYFAERVAASAEPGLILLGERSLHQDCSVWPASWCSTWKALLANCVVGMGLFQGMEFIFGRGPGEILAKTRVGWARMAACRKLISRSHAYHLRLGRDSVRNADVVVEALLRLASNKGKKSR
jgi:hypothetical protein